MKEAIRSILAAVSAVVAGALGIVGQALGVGSSVLGHAAKAANGLGDTVQAGLSRAQGAFK
jgi:hypothetical protein